MMPLTFANVGEENMIKKVGGKPETRKFLENLGFVAWGTVTVVSTIGGNVIVKVKESRVAVSKEMAAKIMVQETFGGLAMINMFEEILYSYGKQNFVFTKHNKGNKEK